MSGWIAKFIDLILYSNLFIALGALCMVWQVQWILGVFDPYSRLAWFMFFSTLFVYAMHRIVGFTIIEKKLENRRIQVIRKFQLHIIIYAIISALAGLYLALQIRWETLLSLLIPTTVSVLYIVPIFGGGRRLRDLPFIKLFAIGIVWVCALVVTPLIDLGVPLALDHYLLLIEKLLFIIGITIPFDIRDIEVDRLYKIDTLPLHLGVKKSIRIALMLLFLAAIIVGVLLYRGFLEPEVATGLILSYMITLAGVAKAHSKRHDYYFAGMLDGTIILQFVLIYLVDQVA